MLSQLKLIQQETKLSAVAAASVTAKHFRLTRDHFIECLDPDSCRNPVVVMGHGASALMSGQQLVLKLRRQLGLQDLGKMV